MEDMPVATGATTIPTGNDLKKRSGGGHNIKVNPNKSIELGDEDDEEVVLLHHSSNEYSNKILASIYPSMWLILITSLWSAAFYTFFLSPVVVHILGIRPLRPKATTDILSFRSNSFTNSFKSFHDEYDLATKQSYGFFTDLSESDWLLMQDRVRKRQNHWDPNNPTLYMDNPPAWYQNNFEPDFTCPHERRVGGLGDGPKWVCDPHRIMPFSDSRKRNGLNGCLVYSVGSQGNFEFEIGLLNTLDKNRAKRTEEGEQPTSENAPCEIHVFDPDDFSGEAPEGIHFHPWGLKSSTDLNMEPNFKSIQETVASLGHEGRVVDIFKIDCEGCEWETYKDWFSSKITMLQILVEVHNSPLPAIDFFETMQDNGYVTFHKESNTLNGIGNCQEYALLKLDPDFFE